MTDREAMKLALDALEIGWSPTYPNEVDAREKGMQAIAALKERLAQPEQEPVAFKIYKPTPPRHATPNVRDAELPWVYDQDPSSGNVASMWVTPVKATPPQRTWVGLTDEEMHECWDSPLTPLGMKHARMIEAKLKQKNGFAEEKNT